MIIQNLLEDTNLQSSGVKYYPDPADDAYFLIRRHGTQEFIKARREIILSMPPVELLEKPDLEARELEIARRLVSEYYVAGMSGLYDESNSQPIVYTKDYGVLIFHHDGALKLVNEIINCSMQHDFYASRMRNITLSVIKLYVENEFHSPTIEDKKDDYDLNHRQSTESYNDSKIRINESEGEIITAFYDACKYRKENEYLTKLQINESYEINVTMTNHYDYVEIIKELDTFYINLKVKKERAQAKARKNDN